MQNIEIYKRIRKDYSNSNENYDKVMKEYERLTFLYDITEDKQIYNRCLMDITIGTAGTGSSYDPETALLPNFSLITNRNVIASPSTTGGSISGTTFVSGIGSFPTTNFMTQRIYLDQDTTFTKGFYLYKANNIVSSNTFDYSDQSPSANIYSYYSAGFGFSNKSINLTDIQNGIWKYDNGAATQIVSGSVFQLGNWHVFCYDTYNLWYGRSTTSTSHITWYKIGKPADLLLSGDYFILRYIHVRASYFSGYRTFTTTLVDYNP